MKRFVIVTLVVIFLTLIALSFKNLIGDLRPALLPPSQDIETIIEKQKTSFVKDVFAKGLESPRDLTFSPEGTLLASIPKQGKVIALPHKNSDGKADSIKDIVIRLNKPHGIAFYNGKLYIAEETKVVRYLWDEISLTATKDKELFALPQGGNHRTRSIAFDKTGRMFISLGSTCNVCFEKHEWLAAVIVSDSDGNNPRLWAKGLRNAVFITINPATDELWGTEMGRDFLGDNLPPDEIDIISNDADYGWPICYGNNIHDTNFDKNTYVRDPCNDTQPPVYEIAAHSAPLGLVFIDSPQFPKEWQGDLLVAYHGSWNRSTPIGYKVVRLNVEGNRGVWEEDFLTGFLNGSEAIGRPVDLVFDKEGSLYISDDKAGVVYKIVRK